MLCHAFYSQKVIPSRGRNSYPLHRRLPNILHIFYQVPGDTNHTCIISVGPKYNNLSNYPPKSYRRLIGIICFIEISTRMHNQPLNYSCKLTYPSFSSTWSTALQFGIPIYLTKDIELLEKIQEVGLIASLYTKDRSLGYDELLFKANVPSLAERHSQARLCNNHYV